MFNLRIQNKGSGRRVYPSFQNTSLALLFCLLASFLVSCSSVEVNGEKHTLIHSADYRSVYLASQAVNDKLERSILTIQTRGHHFTVYEHNFLIVKNIDGIVYFYHTDGSILLPRFYKNGDGTFKIKEFSEHKYQDEEFLDYTIEPQPQEKRRSDTFIPNACLIQAINYQADLYETYGDRLTWTSILHVYYDDMGQKDVGHAYCVFTLKNDFYAYDITGLRKLTLPSYDAMTVAKQLKNHVNDAAYDE